MRSDTAGTNWQSLGRCLDEDPELFFPVGSTGPAVQQVTEAKAVCRTCRVQAQCLEWALEQGIGHGVWGGLDGDERRALRRIAA
jgi:WhiB family transcriptional regulator, redox-sensing transcriptional regulator